MFLQGPVFGAVSWSDAKDIIEGAICEFESLSICLHPDEDIQGIMDAIFKSWCSEPAVSSAIKAKSRRLL